MVLAARRLLMMAAFVTAVGTATPAQQPPTTTSVVLRQVPAPDVSYPPIAESALVRGQLNVQVGVRPDGSVAEVTVFPRADLSWKLLQATTVNAASRATFECHDCTQPSTAHLMTFVFSLDASDDDGSVLPTTWKQTGDASSQINVFGRVPISGSARRANRFTSEPHGVCGCGAAAGSRLSRRLPINVAALGLLYHDGHVQGAGACNRRYLQLWSGAA